MGSFHFPTPHLGSYLLLCWARFVNLFLLVECYNFYSGGAVWDLALLFGVVANLDVLSVLEYTGWLTASVLTVSGPAASP